jgi:Zn-dependent protease
MIEFLVIIVKFLAFVITLTVHEFSHALAGYYLGDETAKRLGRLTLNPIPHIDPVGTIIFPLLGMFTAGPVFGWAKPVPFNPYNLKYGKWGAVMVAMAGPVSNLAVAILATSVLLLLTRVFGLAANNLLAVFLVFLGMISLVLAVFNLIPVAPLDGSRLVSAILDAPKYRQARMFLETRGPLILLAIIAVDFFTRVSILGTVFSAVIGGFYWVFGALPTVASVLSTV